MKKPATATVENAATGFIGADGKVSQAYKDAIEADSSDVTVGNVTGQTAGFNNVKFNSKSSAMSALLPTLNISGSSTVVANAAIDTINSAINAVSS